MQETIQPIINGSVNPRLTVDDFLNLNKTAKRQVIWSILVSLGYAHCFSEVDFRVFEPSPFKVAQEDLWCDTEGSELDLDNLFVQAKKEYKNHHDRMRAKTSVFYQEQGKKIYQAQTELGFGGMIELDKDRLIGYISACGNWNDFNATDVISDITKMHELAPRADYGPNNCNTGMIKHKMKTMHGCEYVIITYDFVDEKMLGAIREFYKNHWEPRGKSISADSVRMEENQLDHGYYEVNLIWWWD